MLSRIVTAARTRAGVTTALAVVGLLGGGVAVAATGGAPDAVTVVEAPADAGTVEPEPVVTAEPVPVVAPAPAAEPVAPVVEDEPVTPKPETQPAPPAPEGTTAPFAGSRGPSNPDGPPMGTADPTPELTLEPAPDAQPDLKGRGDQPQP